MASLSGSSGTGVRRRAAHIIGRLYGAKRRSTCEHHFNEFNPFHLTLSQRIDETTWVQFDSWMKTEIAAPIMNVCFQWQYFGRNAFAMCPHCVSKVEEVPQIVIESNSDESDEEETSEYEENEEETDEEETDSETSLKDESKDDLADEEDEIEVAADEVIYLWGK
ncbi:hypothetical protein FRX31_016274 [Thalictrum thalictroides]|uniref:Uncharacterized protein n=1 Tax=Thalictrum thalictroides TaxID=46969 RepID=A0A7J6W9Q3_THATH|nr:hypothetical protein FRX31_016274 [Thalictrum thalictroides]